MNWTSLSTFVSTNPDTPFSIIPMRLDPMTGTNQSWKIEMEDALRSVNQTEPGIFDIHSGSDKKGLDGTPYSEW